MNDFAIIKTGGKQYVVRLGQKLKIEKLDVQEGAKISFDEVLLRVNGDKIEIGTPFIKNTKVEARVLKQARYRKVIVFRYHSKTRYRKKKGHRQRYTEVEIIKI